MEHILTSLDIVRNGKKQQVINVPAEQCPECGKVEIFDLVYNNAKRYANDCKSQIVDYTKCENEENENLMVLQMLW